MFTFNDYLILFSFFIIFTIRIHYVEIFNITFHNYNMIDWNYYLNKYLKTEYLFDDGIVNIDTFIILGISIYVGCFNISGLYLLITYFLSLELLFIFNNQRGHLFINGLTLIFSFLFGLIINSIIFRKRNETGLTYYDEYKSEILDFDEMIN